jgi:hypothetical protein
MDQPEAGDLRGLLRPNRHPEPCVTAFIGLDAARRYRTLRRQKLRCPLFGATGAAMPRQQESEASETWSAPSPEDPDQPRDPCVTACDKLPSFDSIRKIAPKQEKTPSGLRFRSSERVSFQLSQRGGARIRTWEG